MNVIYKRLEEKDVESFHDCKIYALKFNDENFELLLDIDFISKCQKGINDEYNYWVSSSTLIFRNVYDFNLTTFSLDLVIQEISKENAIKPKNNKHILDLFEYDWDIETLSGNITFKSTGFELYLRKPPILLEHQTINFVERGGISLNIN
jgi:hypothetical protein